VSIADSDAQTVAIEIRDDGLGAELRFEPAVPGRHVLLLIPARMLD